MSELTTIESANLMNELKQFTNKFSSLFRKLFKNGHVAEYHVYATDKDGDENEDKYLIVRLKPSSKMVEVLKKEASEETNSTEAPEGESNEGESEEEVNTAVSIQSASSEKKVEYVDISIRCHDENNKIDEHEKVFKGVQFSDEALKETIADYLKTDLPGTDGSTADWFGSDHIEDENVHLQRNANSSRKLNVTLQKIDAGTHSDIQLVSITSNYEPLQVLSDIDAVLDSEEFVDELSSDPTSYEILSEPDSEDLTVEPCENFMSCDLECKCAWTIIQSALICKYNADFIYYNIEGPKVSIRENLQSWVYDDIIRCLSEYCVSTPNKFVPNMITILSDPAVYPFVLTETSEKNSYLSMLYQNVQGLIAALELYSCNFPNYIQNNMMNWEGTVRNISTVIDKYMSE